MDGHLSSYGLFTLDDPWRKSSLTTDIENSLNIFGEVNSELPPLDTIVNQDSSRLHLDWNLPKLTHGNVSPSTRTENEDDVVANEARGTFEAGSDQGDDALSIWNADPSVEDKQQRPTLHTWDVFEGRSADESLPAAYLSEAGPLAFDAALFTLRESGAETGVLPRDVVLRAMCSMILGRSSVFFQWNPVKKAFEATLLETPASGFSYQSYASLWTEFARFGGLLMRLREFAGDSTASPGDTLPTLLALKSSLSAVLDGVDESISPRLSDIASFLQLQDLIERPSRLLMLLNTLMNVTNRMDSEEELVSSLSDCVNLEVQLHPEFAPLLQRMLARISTPWLERIGADIGLWPSIAASTSGEIRAPPADNTMLTADDQKLINEARATLRLLKDHALSESIPHLPPNSLSISKSFPPSYEHSDPSKMTFIARFVEHSAEHKTRPHVDSDAAEISREIQHRTKSQDPWLADWENLEFKNIADRPPGTTDGLRDHVLALLQMQDRGHNCEIPVPLHGISIAPFDEFRPLLRKQARLLNGVMLRHVLRECHLQHHLQMLRSFYLFDNGDFVTRLSTALFSAETQVAERRRGVTPTASVVGLRLGASSEQQWPPASSELQLSLLGILNETYQPWTTSRKRSTMGHAALPGGLSFSIRELPEEEIERTLNASSIYALDFLRLQYEAPPPLDSILTPDDLQYYDHIFRWLLRLLRLMHVTADLKKQVSGRHSRGNARNGSTSFALEAHDFVHTLVSHYLDIGIDAPWRLFTTAVTNVSKDLDVDDAESEGGTKATASLADLQHLHRACLERMRSRLFLKRSQQKLRDALEDVLSAILSESYQFRSHAASDDDEIRKTAVSSLRAAIELFCDLLQDSVNRLPKSGDPSEAHEEVEVVKMLLLRLRWK